MSAFRYFGIAGIAILGGCSVNPNTGRNQLIAFPAVQIAHADMSFSVASAAQGLAPSAPCFRGTVMPACPSIASVARFSRQVERIGAELATVTSAMSPGLFSRIGPFRISVENDIGAGTASSAGGRIALDSSLAATDPTDDVVAFLIAREMGHVIARHGEEDSGARLAFSLLTTVVPVGGLIARFAASIVGSQALKASWAEGQRREADDLALTLLEHCNRPAHVIALNLRVGLVRHRLPAGEWSTYFAQSIERVAAIAFVRPRSGDAQLASVIMRDNIASPTIEGGDLQPVR